jgi:hypothetical protein
VGVSFLLRGRAVWGSSAWGEVWPTLSPSLRRGLRCGSVTCGEYMCGENAYRVWFVAPMGFIVWFVVPMGFIVWFIVPMGFISIFFKQCSR